VDELSRPFLPLALALAPRTLAELGALLCRAEAGEFTISNREIASQTPADLLRLIDDLVSRLPERKRSILTLYLGATDEKPWTLQQIGLQHGIKNSRVGQLVSQAIRWMRPMGNPKLSALLDPVEGVCARVQAPPSPALVSTWQDPARPFRYSAQFYAAIISRLRAVAGWTQAKRGPRTQASGNKA
jgi:hypothetical protein